MKSGRLSYLLLLVPCVLVKFGDVCASNSVPVLMWSSDRCGNNENSPSPLTKLKTSDYFQRFSKRFLGEKTSEQVIVLFVEEMLSVEDFSRINAQGLSSYPFLSHLSSAAPTVDYLPSVESPLKALKELDYEWREFDPQDGLNAIVPEDGGVILVTYFKDSGADERRSDILKQHDQVMQDVYSQISSEHRHVVGIYTSKHQSWQRPDIFLAGRRLLASDSGEGNKTEYRVNSTWYDKEEDGTFLMVNFGPILIISDTVDFIKNETLHVTSDISNMTESQRVGEHKLDKQEQIVTVDFSSNSSESGTLNFAFYLDVYNYWRLNDISVTYKNLTDKQLFPTSEISAPIGFSYHCSQNTSFNNTNNTFTLKFKLFQIQAFIIKKGNITFGDGYDCVPFYTPGMLSGLMVTTMIIVITMWGLSMIMDIRTNDLYDDPKGKTITVNAD